MIAEKIRRKIKIAPQSPGVYLFYDKRNKVIYVGKAKNLRLRLKFYLKSSFPKIDNLLKEARDLKIIKTNSEAEAILKESELIKIYDPPYNQLLRDDSNFFYVLFTKETFPKVIVTHQPAKFSYLKLIGPFIRGTSLKKVLRVIRGFMKFCTCENGHFRECINSSVGLCFGFCCQKNAFFKQNEIDKYFLQLSLLEKILKGDFKKLKRKLLNDIKKLLKNKKIEKAVELKNAYQAIKILEEQINLIDEGDNIGEIDSRKILYELAAFLRLKKIPERIEAYDISHFSGQEKVGIMVVFIFGKYQPQLKRKFKIREIKLADDARMIYEVLKRRLKHPEWGLPDIILVDGGLIQRKFALQAVQESGYKIKVISFAKPSQEIFYDDKKPAFKLQNLPIALQNFIKNIDLIAHQNVLKYHQSRRLRAMIYQQ